MSTKVRLLLCMCLLAGFAKAQVNNTWWPLRPGTRYNFKADTALLPVSVVIKTDSAQGNQYYLNKVVTACDTCRNSRLANDFWDSTYVLSNQPQFLGHSFTVLPGNVFYFKGPRRLVLKPLAATGAMWLYDSLQNISATMMARSAQLVFGQIDSIALIKLSTNDTLVLSKNMGLLRFPFTTLSRHTYRLAGVEGQANVGIRLKRFHDFFDFSVGDVFQYSFRDEDYNNLPPTYISGLLRWDILAANIYADSVRYIIRKTYSDSSGFFGNQPVFTAYTVTTGITFIDSAQHMANAYPLQQINVRPYFVFDNGLHYIHKVKLGMDNRNKMAKSFGQNCPSAFLGPGATGAAMETAFANVFINKNSARITGRELTEGLGFTSELFNNYDRIVQRCLIGYIKGSDTSGTIYPAVPTGIQQLNSTALRCELLPNPANDVMVLKTTAAAAANVQIISALGQLVNSFSVAAGQPLTRISTAELANGVYFVVISGHAYSEVKKLIIQH